MQDPDPAPGGGSYAVLSGDTCFNLAEDKGVTLQQLEDVRTIAKSTYP